MISLNIQPSELTGFAGQNPQPERSPGTPIPTAPGAPCAGMTLVEVLIATMFVSMAAMGILAGIVQGARLNYATAQRVAACGLGKDVLEQVRGTPYSQITEVTFGSEPVQLTHLGGSRRLPLMAVRSNRIVELTGPLRKEVRSTVAWEYGGHALSESVYAVVYYRDERNTSTVEGGPLSGSVNINPNHSTNAEFYVALADGTRIDLTSLTSYVGPAVLVHLSPKGNGSQTTLTFNGAPYTLENNAVYDIAADDLSVTLWSSHPLGHPSGQWYITFSSDHASITRR